MSPQIVLQFNLLVMLLKYISFHKPYQSKKNFIQNKYQVF